MARFLAAFFLLNAMALPANADQTNWKLDDVGIVKHSVHGEGVEIRIKPEPIPEGLFDQDADLVQIFRELCSHYAPSVVPFVMEKVDIEAPEYVAVRIVSGKAFGRYILQAFEFSDNTCGDEL